MLKTFLGHFLAPAAFFIDFAVKKESMMRGVEYFVMDYLKTSPGSLAEDPGSKQNENYKTGNQEITKILKAISLFVLVHSGLRIPLARFSLAKVYGHSYHCVVRVIFLKRTISGLGRDFFTC